MPLARVDRAALYGRRRKVVVDEQGENCASAWLSSDGQVLVPAGGLAQVYLDEAGNAVARGDLEVVDEHGEVVDKLPSTLGIEHELYGPVAPDRVLEHAVKSVYLLEDDAIGPRLGAALDAGSIFEGEFRYLASTTTNILFLLRNDEGTFGLVCQPAAFDFVEQAAPTPDDEDQDENEEEDEDGFEFGF